jgi:hypothetical protein
LRLADPSSKAPCELPIRFIVTDEISMGIGQKAEYIEEKRKEKRRKERGVQDSQYATV